jgi:hypothetical protein
MARLAPALAVAVCAAACGSSTSVVAVPSPPTLSPQAVPYLPSKFTRLTAAQLAREAGTPRLRRELGTWGFVAAADRYFQGQSRQLQVVDSRKLQFANPAGAAKFVAFVRVHASVYLGSYPGMRRFTSRGRSGILATAQECTCHLANPAFLAVVARGGEVTWLEINGPGATASRLARLIAAAP